MACGCGKSREQRAAERAERQERIAAVRAERVAVREQRLARQRAATGTSAKAA